MNQPLPDNCSLLYSRDDIDSALDQLADELNRRFEGRSVIALCVMNGGLIFTGQLLPRLAFDCVIDYCHATRYRNSTSGHELHWLAEPRNPLQGASVLVLDDILDEGITLQSIIGFCRRMGARELVTAVLLDKQHDRRVAGLNADHHALQVDDRYVFGYGMDLDGHHRNLDGIYALDES